MTRDELRSVRSAELENPTGNADFSAHTGRLQTLLSSSLTLTVGPFVASRLGSEILRSRLHAWTGMTTSEFISSVQLLLSTHQPRRRSCSGVPSGTTSRFLQSPGSVPEIDHYMNLKAMITHSSVASPSLRSVVIQRAPKLIRRRERR